MEPLGNHRRPFLLVQILSRPAVKAVVNSLIYMGDQVSLCSFIINGRNSKSESGCENDGNDDGFGCEGSDGSDILLPLCRRGPLN